MKMQQLFIIKIGGNIIDDETALHSFLQDFASITTRKILVHGGGKIATRIGEQINTGIELEITALGERSMTGYGGLINK